MLLGLFEGVSTTTLLIWAALVAAGYFLGAIPTGLVIGRLMKGIDLRRVGSGNTGATNALRVLGRLPSAGVLLGDVVKALLAVLVAKSVGAPMFVMAAVGVSAVAGHCWSAYIGFGGGKGVACALGAGLALFWPAGVIGAVLAAPVMALTRYASLGALVGTAGGTVVVLTAAAFGWLNPGSAFFAVAAAVVFYRHRENLRRLLAGTERKLGEKITPHPRINVPG